MRKVETCDIYVTTDKRTLSITPNLIFDFPVVEFVLNHVRRVNDIQETKLKMTTHFKTGME